MTTPVTNADPSPNPLNSLPPRRVPGWLYAILFIVTVAGYIFLVETGHNGDTATLLLIATPILSSVFVADRVAATAKLEGQATRYALTNGSFTKGLLHSLDHPDVVAKIGHIVASSVNGAVPASVPPVDTPPVPPATAP